EGARRKLALGEVFPPAVYEPIRDDMRRRVIELKKRRRVTLGPVVTLVFENRATLISQICEMLRAEHLSDPAKIQEEIDVYNTLLPGDGELSATLFVEITEAAAVRPMLRRLLGIDAHVALLVEGERVQARFEEGRSDEERISSVQYVRFRPGEAARAAMARPGARCAIVCDLPDYQH